MAKHHKTLDIQAHAALAAKARAVGISTIERGWEERYAAHVRRQRNVKIATACAGGRLMTAFIAPAADTGTNRASIGAILTGIDCPRVPEQSGTRQDAADPFDACDDSGAQEHVVEPDYVAIFSEIERAMCAS